MYILFINLGGKCDIFVSTQFNNYSNKKFCLTHEFNLAQPNPCWVGLDLCNRLDWVEFFLTHYGGLGQKIPSTRPKHIPKCGDG